MPPFDAFLLLSFGGPEGRDDVMPFLENVTRGRGVSRERLLEVAEHYYHFNGVSPINAQNRQLIEALRPRLAMPIYWGNRNWHPFLADTMRQMRDAGVKHALVFPTSAFSSYSGCRQYIEDVERARAEVGEGAPRFTIIRRFFNHPAFVALLTRNAQRALARIPNAKPIFTAHSIPLAMASTSDYAAQLEEAARLVAANLRTTDYRLAYQSRSGPPHIPWLEPDILDALTEEQQAGTPAVAVHPIGFLSDHMEVLYDLDYEAANHASDIGLPFIRVDTPGADPLFLDAITALVAEYTHGAEPLSIGNLPPRPPSCAPGCCPAPIRPQNRT